MLSSEILCDVKQGYEETGTGTRSAHQCHCGRQSWATSCIRLLPIPSCLLRLQDHSKIKGHTAFPGPSVSDVFMSHFDDAATCDITVTAGEVKICAHKIVLIAHSALFRGMFQVRQRHLQHKAVCKRSDPWIERINPAVRHKGELTGGDRNGANRRTCVESTHFHYVWVSQKCFPGLGTAAVCGC